MFGSIEQSKQLAVTHGVQVVGSLRPYPSKQVVHVLASLGQFEHCATLQATQTLLNRP